MTGDDADGEEPPPDGSRDDTEIRRLDQATIERIAAGEVVERPASVVKELVENSVDADASRIDVSIDGDGTETIRVRDDGEGMTEADVRAAVQEHTTSKIADIDDLEAGVHTLGFRGEALHTIGAVSRVTIRTKPRGGDRGTELRYEGGETVSVDPAGCPEGTVVEVEDLFYNTPARRKYLKTEATEFAHVNRIVSRYALANPDVAVSLEHDGRETFATTGQGDLRGAIMSVYGREVAEAMIPVVAGGSEDPAVPPTAMADGPTDLPEGPVEGMSGFVSHPETTRSSREYVSSFVNGRWVDAQAVREAVVEAYGGQLAADRYPFVVLFLDLPAGSVDVNVHPRKMEVRFDDEAAVRKQVRAAVRRGLLDHGLVRKSAPRGRSAPDEARVSPDSGESDTGNEDEDEDETGESDRASGTADAGESTPSYATDPVSPDADLDASTGTGDAGTIADASGAGDATASGASAGSDDPSGETGATDATDSTGATDATSGRVDSAGSAGSPDSASSTGSSRATGGRSRPAAGGGTDRRPGKPDRADADDASGSDGRSGGPTADDPPARKFDGPTEQRTLDGDRATPDTEYDRLPRMRVLGQYDDTYVVAETPEGLVLVDQHAADERVNYERLRAAFEQTTTAQALAEPVDLSVTAGEAATFEAARDALAELGFDADLVDGEDGTALRVRAVPAVFDHALDPERLRDVLGSFVAGDHADATVETLADEFISDLACYPSITGNTSLTEGSVVDLLAALDRCENPYACPHGRPVIVEIDGEEIENRFERDYPGHGHRRDA